jgi:hypothetical protein
MWLVSPSSLGPLQGVQRTIDASDSFASLLTGLGCAGLFISLPAGMIADRWGTGGAVA